MEPLFRKKCKTKNHVKKKTQKFDSMGKDNQTE